MTVETIAETLEQIGKAGAERRDMAKGEAVEPELDALISKRHERPASGRRGRV